MVARMQVRVRLLWRESIFCFDHGGGNLDLGLTMGGRECRYVFDHSWAGLASRYGMQYYPKLQSCVPFSPVTGPRLLVNAPGLTSAVTRALIDMLKTVAGEPPPVPTPPFPMHIS